MELKGFKSFANDTTIDFSDGLTVIVGPNGSGKSNINDALKWVLGESSNKSLRASNAKDMIFSGTKTIGPADYAEVTLYFDNTNKYLDIEEDEISVTRKSFRKKDVSEYYINGELVRRKDIKRLFLDTGLGNTDLSIISQGSVANVTESKPLELKKLLDEAAGVSKYQVQKAEAIKKLENVSSSIEIFDTKLRVLNKQLKPLREASDKAGEYRKLKDKLTKIELPLLKVQLVEQKTRFDEIIDRIQILETKKENINKMNVDSSSSLKEIQLELLDIDKKVNSLQVRQTELQSSLGALNVEGDADVLEEKIKHLSKSVNDLKSIINNSKDKEFEISKSINELKARDFDLVSKNESIETNLNKIKYELSRMEADEGGFKHSVKKIVENKEMFNTIYGVIEQLISYKQEFELAVKSAVGSKLGNLVVNNEQTIKEAVNFLRENKYGTATFIPAEKVKPKKVNDEVFLAISRINGFKGTLSDFIKTDEKFTNVVSSIAGNIVLFETLNDALAAAKFIDYKATFVTMDGDIIYPGFTVRGGYSDVNSKKERKEKLVFAEKKLRETLEKQNNELQEVRDELRVLGGERNTIQNEEIRISERLNYLETQKEQTLASYKNVTGKNFDLNSISDYVDSNNDGEGSLEQITNKIRNLQQRKTTLSNEMINMQEQQSDFNKEWGEIIEEVSSLKIEQNNLDSSIAQDIQFLNTDYKISYDALIADKDIKAFKGNEEKREEANVERLKLRESIKELGFVDIESIEKFEELEKEYQDLKVNTDELKETKEKLESTITIMDEEMLVRLRETFDKVNAKFDSIFKMLFRGGNARIVFTEPENILESGIEIKASAPGKAVKNLRLYSGGEKSLIALSLIFAINEVRNLPLLLLDEVEAALDEANVERFANFAKVLNESTQLIIVSHRPGTMEKADYLYGVTMQRKGITSIFNVKLEEAVEMTE